MMRLMDNRNVDLYLASHKMQDHREDTYTFSIGTSPPSKAFVQHRLESLCLTSIYASELPRTSCESYPKTLRHNSITAIQNHCHKWPDILLSTVANILESSYPRAPFHVMILQRWCSASSPIPPASSISVSMHVSRQSHSSTPN